MGNRVGVTVHQISRIEIDKLLSQQKLPKSFIFKG